MLRSFRRFRALSATLATGFLALTGSIQSDICLSMTHAGHTGARHAMLMSHERAPSLDVNCQETPATPLPPCCSTMATCGSPAIAVAPAAPNSRLAAQQARLVARLMVPLSPAAAPDTPPPKA